MEAVVKQKKNVMDAAQIVAKAEEGREVEETGNMHSTPRTPSGRVDYHKIVARNKACVINPEESAHLRQWDLVTTGCLVFVCFISPYEVAFHKQSSEVDFLFVLNRTVDLIFTLDMLLHFFIMYPAEGAHGVLYISEHRLIVRRYLRTWFFIDLISILPFDTLAVVMESEALSKLSILRVVRLIRLLKLVRLLRGMRIIKRYELEIGFSYRKLTLLKLLIGVIVAAHWVACCLGVTNMLQGEVCHGVNEPVDCSTTWFSADAMHMVQEGQTLAPWRVYTVALHVASTYIVHPHHSPPTGDAERIVFTLLVFAGGFVWTRVISQTTAVTTSMSRHSNAYHSLMDDLNATAKDLKLPQTIKRRIRSFFMKTNKSSQRNTWNEIVKKMSPVLQTQVSYHIHKVWLARVAYLKGLPMLFNSHLTLGLHHIAYAAQETFGDVYKLYIMHMGVCSRSSGKCTVMLEGTVWGDEHLLLSSPKLLSPNTAYSITFTEVFALSRQHFQSVLEDFPELQPKIRKFVVWYAVVRGIVHEANRLKGEMTDREMSTQYTDLAEHGKGQTLAARQQEEINLWEFHENVRQKRKSVAILTKNQSELDSLELDARVPKPRGPRDSLCTAPDLRTAFKSNGEKPIQRTVVFDDQEMTQTASTACVGAGSNALQEMEDRIMSAIKGVQSDAKAHQAVVLKRLDLLQQRVGTIENCIYSEATPPPESAMPLSLPSRARSASPQATGPGCSLVTLPRDSWDIHKFAKEAPSWDIPIIRGRSYSSYSDRASVEIGEIGPVADNM